MKPLWLPLLHIQQGQQVLISTAYFEVAEVLSCLVPAGSATECPQSLTTSVRTVNKTLHGRVDLKSSTAAV